MMSLKSYGFAVGSLRARENLILKRNDFKSLLSSDNTEQLCQKLYDKGIGLGAESSEIPDMLKFETKKLWEYIGEIAPDMSYFLPFFYENDFHNLKATLKAVITGNSTDRLLITPASVDTKLIERAVKETVFDILPDFMADTAREAYEILSRSGDAQLCDGIIDARCMSCQLKTAEETKNETIREIIRNTVFFNQIKIALRSAKANKTSEFLDLTLIESGVIPKKELKSASLIGEDKVLELLSGIDSVQGEKAAELYLKAPWMLEKFADELNLKKANECMRFTMGIEPIVGYMLIKLNEIKNLRIIWSGVKTGQDISYTEERLRDVNG